MKHATTLLIAAILVFGLTMQYAAADNPMRGSMNKLRSVGTSRLIQSGISRVSRNTGRSFKFPSVSNSIRTGSNRTSSSRGWERRSTNNSITEGLGRLSQSSRSPESFRRSGNSGMNVFGEMLRGLENYSDHGLSNIPYYGYGNRHHHDNDEMADAYRDAAIANAVVGLVGVLVSAAQQPQYPQYAPVAATPVHVTAPAGHWERQVVVVQPAHYETYQEWIPEIYDSRTGQRIGGGYYESRSRLVPETFQYKDVWVTP